MSEPIARFEFVQRDAATLIVTVDGEVDLSNVGDLRRQLDGAATHQKIVMDLRRTTYLDSAGLALIAELGMQAALHIVAGEQTTVWRTLRVAGFTDLYPVHASMDDVVCARD